MGFGNEIERAFALCPHDLMMMMMMLARLGEQILEIEPQYSPSLSFSCFVFFGRIVLYYTLVIDVIKLL